MDGWKGGGRLWISRFTGVIVFYIIPTTERAASVPSSCPGDLWLYPIREYMPLAFSLFIPAASSATLAEQMGVSE